MLTTIVLTCAVLLQFLAVLYALKLIKLTGKACSWIRISIALFLMMIRRMIPLYYLIFKNPAYPINLINDILDISKIEAGQLQIMSEIFDLKKSIEKTVRIISPIAGKKNLRLHSMIGHNISEMRGDQRRVEQIILNLLSNAVKFTNRGEINLNGHVENNSVIISVQDTGIGIKPENVNIIFDAFRQVESEWGNGSIIYYCTA
jgi:K+-sensing histidine kinase KdpD